MTDATPEDLANGIKLLERLRTGELNVIPSLASIEERKQDASTAMLQRVEDVLRAAYRRVAEPVGDGGPAFPEPGLSGLPNGEFIHGRAGMTLRDYFAAQFMERAQSLSETRDGGWDFVNVAQCCYAMADEMLKARSA